MIERKQIQVSGIVQSVGFRPFVYALAKRHGLNGFVLNNARGVLIDVEGRANSIDDFVASLKTEPPPLARIEAVEVRNHLEPRRYREFQIVATAANAERVISISPDVSTCPDCLRELFDPANRRFRYPFVNCTNCGPRFTIIEDVPYDRARTTMREFEMCAGCRSEYENPLDRRFHAEPTACATCGPNVYLQAKQASAVMASAEEAICQTISLLTEGKIVAIKGVGGFHLACDAMNENAVTTLRRRKFREDKPFALMAHSVEVVRQHCDLSPAAAELLGSIERPIVLLPRRADSPLPGAIAPRIASLGFMLPYSPLHYLLLEKFNRPLVMTSANISDEPICYEDEDARQRLSRIADYFLMHNRRIHMRTDDSVARVVAAASPHLHAKAQSRKHSQRPLPMILRRSRGYAPAPIKTAFHFDRQILACGAELKNTFCLTRDRSAFVSHHIGDLENLETLRSFTEGIQHFQQLFYLRPEVIAYDLHPEYLSTKYALSCDEMETKIGVQHHHAHIASCMADNQIEGEVIGVAMDGLGYGADGRMWGGEFFVANLAEAERIAHLGYMPMPGGAKAIREPWRMAAAYLQQTFGEDFVDLDLQFVRELDRKKWKTLNQMIAGGANCPETSSMGRLFDAVSSLLRLRDFTNYEGQAAIELEQIADETTVDTYEFQIDDAGVIRAEPLVRAIVDDLLARVPVSIISTKFHSAVADLIVRVAVTTRERYQLNRVVMSGGVFQNLVLLRTALVKLAAAEFEVFTHCRVPTNDGGISLGQAAIANAQLRRHNH